MPLQIFLSHSHTDSMWCDDFVAELSKYPTNIWYDRLGLYAGAQWVRTIEDELSTRDIFLIVLTPEAWASKWVREELALAFAAQKRIIGVIHTPTQVSGFITQRQLISALGLTGTDAANLVASSLGLRTNQQYTTSYSPPPTLPQQLNIDINGRWIEITNHREPLIIEIEQNNADITGAGAGGPGMASTNLIGSIKGRDINIHITGYGGWTNISLELKLINETLVGTINGTVWGSGELIKFKRY